MIGAVTYPLKVSRLPVFSEKDKILEKVNGFDVLVLSAATGSGKSTTVPLFLCECFDLVICTQTRRFAAKSLCFSVRDFLRDSPLKASRKVGYHIRNEKSQDGARIMYMTEGISFYYL